MKRSALAAALLFLVLAFCQAKKAHHRSSRLFRHISDRVEDEETESSANHLAKQEDQEDACHRTALHKCGHTFLRAHKLIAFLGHASDLLAFRTRCGLRTAFFECLKLTRERICSRHHHPPPTPHVPEPDFRKRLTDALWSTRVCVLGVQSFKPPD